MKLPSPEYIRSEIYERYAVPSTIRQHCEKVRDVGEVLANGLQIVGVQVDIPLVDSGCLVHDAMKAVTLPPLTANPSMDYIPTAREIAVQAELKGRYPNLHETLITADLLKPEFPDFSRFVANIGSTGNPTYLDGGVELKIIHYADWRVQFTRIVPFKDRLQYLKDTYLSRQPEKGDAWWEAAVEKELQLEDEIFRHLPFKPDDLAHIMGQV